MSSVLFRGAGLRFVDIRKPKEGGPFVRLHLVSDFTEGIIDAMEWEEIPDCVSSAKLPGELPAQSLVLTPVDIALQQYELQLECSDVSDFQLHRIQDREHEDVMVTELRFVARSNQRGAAALLENWLATMGFGRGTLKVQYAEQVKTEGVDDGSEDEDSPQMRLGEAEDPGGQFVQAADDVEVPGSALQQAMQDISDHAEATAETVMLMVDEPEAAPLATAREAAGGTHAKGRRARKVADLPSAPGDGEGSGDGILKAIQGGGKDEPWSGTITVLDRDGVLSWAVAVKIHGGPMAEADCKGEPPLSIPAAASEAAEYVAEWADSQLSTGERDIKLAAAQIRSWALNAKADNRVSASAESSIRVARGGAR